jgi:hypothetical protein
LFCAEMQFAAGIANLNLYTSYSRLILKTSAAWAFTKNVLICPQDYTSPAVPLKREEFLWSFAFYMAQNHRKGLYVLYSLLSHCFALKCNASYSRLNLKISPAWAFTKHVLICPQGYTSPAVALNLKNSCEALCLTWRRTTRALCAL